MRLIDPLTPQTAASERTGRDRWPRLHRKRVTWELARRRPAAGPIEAYHEHHLRDLLERVREGFAMLDAGKLDAFGLDDLIARYCDAAQALHEFCDPSRGEPQHAANELAALREQGADPDWWQAGERANLRKRRSQTPG